MCLLPVSSKLCTEKSFRGGFTTSPSHRTWLCASLPSTHSALAVALSCLVDDTRCEKTCLSVTSSSGLWFMPLKKCACSQCRMSFYTVYAKRICCLLAIESLGICSYSDTPGIADRYAPTQSFLCYCSSRCQLSASRSACVFASFKKFLLVLVRESGSCPSASRHLQLKVTLKFQWIVTWGTGFGIVNAKRWRIVLGKSFLPFLVTCLPNRVCRQDARIPSCTDFTKKALMLSRMDGYSGLL